MKNGIREQMETSQEVNAITGSAASVIFGTGRFLELPVAELVQDFGLNISVCNRSVEGAVIADAFELLDACVFALHPRKLFLNFGETDMRRADFDCRTFIADYARLIGRIREESSCRVYVVSVLDGDARAEQVNAALRELAREKDCMYVDAAGAFRCEKPRLKLFSELAHYMREGRISFAEAMGACIR